MTENTSPEPKRWLKLDVALGVNKDGYMFCINFKDDNNAGSIRTKKVVDISEAPALLADTLKDLMTLKRNEFEHWLNPQ